MRQRSPVIYIMASKGRTIYIGVTSDLHSRVWQHKHPSSPDEFTARYKCDRLVYFTEFARMDDAIAFEKSLKGRSRATKIALISESNPRWNDLAWNWYGDE